MEETMVKTAKELLEKTFEEEMLAQLQAKWYGHNPDRLDYRNGYRTRSLVTRFGLIKELRVPRSRAGVYESRILPQYARYDESVKALIRESFLGGVSTRRVGEVLEPMLGASVSASTVSRIAKTLDVEVGKFHQRPLDDDVQYLFLDGVYLKLKGVARVQRKVVLTVYGIKVTGEREVIAFKLASSESEPEWVSLLTDIQQRGLAGKKLKLVVTDGGVGLQAALATVYSQVPRQRCWVHKMRNLVARLPVKHREECLAGLREVYQAPNKTEATRIYRAWSAKWQPLVPKVVESMEKDIESLLSFMAEPAEHAKMLRTTNAIERVFRELRRRTNPMSCFNNDKSCERIVYAIVSHQNDKWKGRPHPQFTHKT
jgi:transposase-like protein